MGFVVSITDITPTPRFDNTPWTQVHVFEASESVGPWTEIDVIVLNPVDPDPSQPLTRQVTTENATAASGLWYQLMFTDATGSQQLPTTPILNMPEDLPAYAPGLADVGAIDIARTRDANGVETGTFAVNTRPTASEVNSLILRAVREIRPELGEVIPNDLIDDARNLIALRVAMWIELSYFANEVAQNRSPYPQYKALFEEQRPMLIDAIEREEEGADPDLPLENQAQFNFPPASNWLYGRID